VISPWFEFRIYFRLSTIDVV